MRTFISVDIPENVKEEIVKVQKKLPEFKGKLTERENLHLTLKFLGEVDEEKVEEIKQRLRNVKFDVFDAEIKDIGVFSEQCVRIVWVYLTNCEQLQKAVDEALIDMFEKEKRFMSHLTIARVKSLKDKKQFLEDMRKIKIDKISFSVNSFKLMSSVLTSNGPEYEVIEEYTML